MFSKRDLIKISDYLWEIPQSHRSDMRVPARIYSTVGTLEDIFKDRTLWQLVNVSTLPGIQKYAIAMPDAHEGYGFPVGGVAAFDLDEGVISPGGIGYDINCGVRLLKSDVNIVEIQSYLKNLGSIIYKEVPSGVGRDGAFQLNNAQLDQILLNGAKAVIDMGYGKSDDLNHIESNGKIEGADSSLVSLQAKARGRDQLGTMGAGNHFVEVDVVENIFDEKMAKIIGLFKGQMVILIHTGSRGLGHQVATDYIRLMMRVMPKYGINLPDRELACVPFNSPEGKNYFKGMSAAANFAFANRQMITFEVRQAWKKALGSNVGDLEIVYDVAHNIAKIEEYQINGQVKKLIVHRKGATRSFANQPVLIPGSMGSASYVLIGQKESMAQSFGSTCHGAGRRMSRTKSRILINAQELGASLQKKNIFVKAGSLFGLTEEAPEAYKDIDEVVEVVARAGIAKKVVKLKPVAVIKG